MKKRRSPHDLALNTYYLNYNYHLRPSPYCQLRLVYSATEKISVCAKTRPRYILTRSSSGGDNTLNFHSCIHKLITRQHFSYVIIQNLGRILLLVQWIHMLQLSFLNFTTNEIVGISKDYHKGPTFVAFLDSALGINQSLYYFRHTLVAFTNDNHSTLSTVLESSILVYYFLQNNKKDYPQVSLFRICSTFATLLGEFSDRRLTPILSLSSMVIIVQIVNIHFSKDKIYWVLPSY